MGTWARRPHTCRATPGAGSGGAGDRKLLRRDRLMILSGLQVLIEEGCDAAARVLGGRLVIVGSRNSRQEDQQWCRVGGVGVGVVDESVPRAGIHLDIVIPPSAASACSSRGAAPRGRIAQLIEAAAESVFGAGTRPAAIVLTHIHPDHSGSALELARLWALPVYVHPAELVLARGGYLPEYGNPLDRWLVAPLLRLMPRRAVEASRSRSSLEGTARAFDPAAGVPGLPDWQAVPVPGHTPGHVAFPRQGPGTDHR